MLHKLVGAGLRNVYLDGGVSVEGIGDGRTIAYSNLDGLYVAITRALGRSSGGMPADELRFLRKRLGMSQSDVASLGGKTEQAVAKWEKGTLPVPKAEANLLRLTALSKFGTRKDISRAVDRLSSDAPATDCTLFVFSFDGSNWAQNDQLAQAFANQKFQPEAVAAIRHALSTSATEVLYTLAYAAKADSIVKIDYGNSENATTV